MPNRKRKPSPRRTLLESCDNPKPHEVYRAAMAYKNTGLSFMPIASDRSKEPATDKLPFAWCKHRRRKVHSWAPFKDRQPSNEEIREWYVPKHQYSREFGIAIVCGGVSGGLEVIDLDISDLVEPFKREVEKRSPGLFDKLITVKTPRPGMHIYYRCKTIEGSQKLARTRVQKDGKESWTTLIETKGEGGYVLAPPSPDWCHPLETCYVFDNAKDLTEITMITPEERTVLLESARVFDSYKRRQPQPRRSKNASARIDQSTRPGDDFNQRGEWADILTPHDWTYAGTGSGGEGHWTRPGKQEGTSATTNHAGTDLLYVFSQNASPFDAEESYSKFHAFALLEHDGDFAEAARELRRRGYGSDQQGSPRRPSSVSSRSARKSRTFR